MIESNKGMENSTLETIHISSSVVRDEVASLSTRLHKAPDRERQRLVDTWQVQHTDKTIPISGSLWTVVRDERLKLTASLILHSLYFPQMKERYDGFAVAHAKTFNWVFDSTPHRSVPWANSVRWLENRDDLVSLY